jgi:uncharacterized protein
MKQKLSTAILFFTVAYFSIGLLLYISQRSFLYFPTPVVTHNFDNVVIHNEGESINVILVNKEQNKALLYFGGNGETVAVNAPIFANIFPGYTVYLVNYRGYGGSTGSPGERGFYSDALSIFDKIKTKHSEISIMGRSLGTGVATYLAAKRDIGKLVLITPFDSIQNVAKQRFPIYPIKMLLKDKFDSLSRVKDIKAQTLVLIAENDEVIGLKHTENLVKTFPASQVTVKTILNAGHNTLSENDRYYQILKNFL